MDKKTSTSQTDFANQSGETENEVKVINSAALTPSVAPIAGTANPLADQAAAMMVQDAQSFLQGNEQFLTVAPKASTIPLNPDPNATAITYTSLSELINPSEFNSKK